MQALYVEESQVSRMKEEEEEQGCQGGNGTTRLSHSEGSNMMDER